MKRTRHGNRRSHRKLKRYHAQRCKEETQGVDFLEKGRAYWEEHRKFDSLAVQIASGFLGVVYGMGRGRSMWGTP